MLKKLLPVLTFFPGASFVVGSLVAVVTAAMPPLLVAVGEARGTEPDTDIQPLAEICLLSDERAGNTCAAFFLDRDGYQICLKDEMSGKFRCSGTFSTDEGDEEEAKPTGALSDDGKI